MLILDHVPSIVKRDESFNENCGNLSETDCSIYDKRLMETTKFYIHAGQWYETYELFWR